MRSHRFRKHGSLARSQTLPEPELSTDEQDPLISPSDGQQEELLDPPIPPDATSDAMSIEQSRDTLMKKFIHLYMSLNSVHHIPERTLQYVIETYRVLLEESPSVMFEEIL